MGPAHSQARLIFGWPQLGDVHRRRYLRLLAAGSIAAAGCPDAARAPTPEPRETGTVAGTELPVPLSAMRQPLPRDYIPAIVDPAFGTDWQGLGGGTRLPADAPVIGVTREGRERAYPIRVLARHEIVNDDLGGPVAVTYCVLCGSGVVFERRVAGQPTIFGVSGKLWRSDLVLYDALTDSLWSQLAATAIRGSRTGERLEFVPSTLTTWGKWGSRHPETEVLLPPPRSRTVGEYDRSFDYATPKYGYGEESQLVGRDSFDGGLHPRTLVVGVAVDGEARAYPFQVVTDEVVVTDRVGDRPVVVTATPEGRLVAYDRRVDGETLRFVAADVHHLRADGSRWRRATGEAVDGPHEGAQLRRASTHPPMFWTGWSEFNPETDVYGIEADGA